MFKQTQKSYLDTHVSIFVIRNRKLLISRAPTKAKSNQLIHRRLTKSKSIGSGQDPESQAGRQSDGYGEWYLELRRGGRYEEDGCKNKDIVCLFDQINTLCIYSCNYALIVIFTSLIKRSLQGTPYTSIQYHQWYCNNYLMGCLLGI